MQQAMFEGLAFAARKKPARREKYLTEMAVVVLWAALEAAGPSHWAAMLRIYFMQQRNAA